MNDAFGLVYTSENDMRLRELTRSRSVAAVPIGGRYRIIDVVLSNLVNTGIRNVGVITQKNYHSLMDHLGSGKEWDLGRKRDGLFILPPFVTRENTGVYNGILDAIRSNMGYVRRSMQKYVILTGSYCVFNATYERMLEFHIANKADITVMYDVPNSDWAEENEGVYLGVDAHKRVYDVEIAPTQPRHPNVSMDVYIMEKELLMDLVDQCVSRGQYDLSRDILQKMRDELRIFGYQYNGFVSRVDSINAFYRLNMALLDEETRLQLLYEPNSVYTKVKDEPSTQYREGSSASNCLVADGCIIDGQISDSVLFRSVTVGKGAIVKGCVLMQGVQVQPGAVLEHVIVDKSAVIKENRKLAGQSDYPMVISKSSVI